jgi:hypothetical protein
MVHFPGVAQPHIYMQLGSLLRALAGAGYCSREFCKDPLSHRCDCKFETNATGCGQRGS